MDRINDTITAIEQQGVLPLYYHAQSDACIAAMQALYGAGIRLIEFTNRGEHALPNFLAMVAERNATMPDLKLGIGTILSEADALAFIDAGADFLVSPVFDAAIADVAYMQKILWIPGCMTPTEIHTAAKAGCTLVKLFPGNVLGAGFVDAIKTLFPHVKMMPTGGVEPTIASMQVWFKAGVIAVGMGSKLLPNTLLETKDIEAITANTQQLLQNVAASR
ncbi:MAG TPA: bifunctional 4-hydroxy-2-oxoglutarate aldolase/2-dehydro-3-deoxy-phosphogluconate aldolase [Chitinophagaceae bacterium]|nr:bifunctional 4-hydroxy-2-oxoglutarate aldolase/2-dehydro-3-deoxy-phosphogluconate aldolase [Chitinophagaceae bacterium]HAN38809.1 bifunctional 4-hydroxy-2-oxoglutarate aldolase/2-dehydro-3-deoxy-phosphogluconate aldolase [Chitinophagaceae bacterium]